MALLLTRNEVENLTSEKVEELLSLKMAEKTQLDYKSTLDLEKKRETYKELLKDVTSFANSRGGIILIGVNEPSEEFEIYDQVLGFENSKSVSADLERVFASSIEPRIPGLVVTYLKVYEEKEIIIIYVPHSMIKPHMVNYNKHRSFYIRHTESSNPMSVQEIRDSVLYSANLEKRANQIALEEEYEQIELFIKEKPAFYFQAIPLDNLETPIDVQSEIVKNIMRGDRRISNGTFVLNSQIVPKPTLKGIVGMPSSWSDLKWKTEIHRNGIIQLVHFLHNEYGEENKFPLRSYYTELIRLYFEFCSEIWDRLNIDIQYLMRCKILNSRGVIYFPDDNFRREQETFEQSQIVFQNQVRNVGCDLEEIYDFWKGQLYNVQGKW